MRYYFGFAVGYLTATATAWFRWGRTIRNVRRIMDDFDRKGIVLDVKRKS